LEKLARKKTLIALAALSAAASFAQSSVTISGTFDPSVQNQKVTYAGGASVSNNLIGNNGQGTSQITFKGVEDLGGGLKASFLLENDFNARYDARGNEGTTSAGVNGTNFGTSGGEQYLALEGGFGKIQAGAANTPSLTAQASRQPFSTKIGSGFNGVLGTATFAATTRWCTPPPCSMASLLASLTPSITTPSKLPPLFSKLLLTLALLLPPAPTPKTSPALWTSA